MIIVTSRNSHTIVNMFKLMFKLKDKEARTYSKNRSGFLW